MQTIDAAKIKAFNYIQTVNRMMERSSELQLNYFYYSRIFSDGTRISLSNEDRWFKTFNTKYHNIGVVSNSFNSYEEGYMLWPVYGKEEVHNLMLCDYGITNQISLVLKHHDHTELFTFATDNTRKDMHNVYINKLDVIYKLSLMMKDKIKPLINEVNSDRYLLTKTTAHSNNQDDGSTKSHVIAQYLKKINLNRELIEQLTEREFECLMFLLEGKSAKVISSIMNISKRTVEVHFYNIKKKLHCRSMAELISKIIKNPFSH